MCYISVLGIHLAVLALLAKPDILQTPYTTTSHMWRSTHNHFEKLPHLDLVTAPSLTAAAQAQLVIDNNIAKQHKTQQKVHRLKAIGAGCLTLGIGTGCVLALGLLGPGGLLFAPSLAAPAFSASVAGGAAVAGATAAAGDYKTHKQVAYKETSKVWT